MNTAAKTASHAAYAVSDAATTVEEHLDAARAHRLASQVRRAWGHLLECHGHEDMFFIELRAAQGGQS